MLKRIIDVVLALTGFIIFSPLVIIIAIWVKFDSPGPVFYRGVRVGRYGEKFRIFKFRSMVMNADKSGVSSTSSQDTRITSSGRFIRKWKIDELSQLINVINGDMSLVGPRPEVLEFVELYSDEEKKILIIRPGITDWASIWNADEGGVLKGALDADKVYAKVIRPTKLNLQLYYLKNRSIFVDLKILVYTAYRIINKSFVPRELDAYPDFITLRCNALKVIESQNNN